MTNSTDKSILTAAGKALLAQLNAEEKALVIDKMIFANVPNRPEYPQPDDVVPTDHIVHQEQVEQRGRLSADSVIYSTTLTSDVGPFDFNWTGAYCSEYGVLVTIDHHALTPKTADEPGVAGNTLVRSVVLEYKDIAEITNITVDASSWQYNATERMKKMDSDVAQSIIDQNGKDWFIEDGFLVTPSGSAYSIKAGAGYVSGNRVTLEFDRNVQVPNKPSFIYVDAHREGTPTGEQVTLFDFVITAEEKDDYTDTNGAKHFVCKIAQVLADGSASDLRVEGERETREKVAGKPWKKGEIAIPEQVYTFKKTGRPPIRVFTRRKNIVMGDSPDFSLFRIEVEINVTQFGAKGDGSNANDAFYAASIAAHAARTDDNRRPAIRVPHGRYLITEDIGDKNTWVLDQGVEIIGLPLVEPAKTQDFSRLKGTVIFHDGILQWTSIYVGDASQTIQKTMGVAYAAEVMGASDNAAGGVTGTSHSAGNDTANQSCIGLTGVGLNNNQNVTKTVWGAYLEGIKLAGVQGNAFCDESTVINYGKTVSTTPYQQPGEHAGVTFSKWLSCGNKTKAGSSTDATGAIGIIGKDNSQYDRGIIFYANSVRRKEAIALPFDYSYVWYDQYNNIIARESQKLSLKTGVDASAASMVRRVNSGPNPETKGSEMVSYLTARGTGINGNEVRIAEHICYQNSDFNELGNAEGKHILQVNMGDGSFSGMEITPQRFSPLLDNQFEAAKPTARYKTIHLINQPSVTCSRKYKDNEREIPESVLRAIKKVPFKLFEYKESIETKGGTYSEVGMGGARTHVNPMIEDIIEAFEEEGIDPWQFALIRKVKWEAQEEIIDEEDGTTIQPAVEAGERLEIVESQFLALKLASIGL